MKLIIIIGLLIDLSYLLYSKLNKNVEKNEKLVNILLVINIIFVFIVLIFVE